MKIGLKSRLYNAEVRNRRVALGVSQGALSKAIGYKTNVVGMIETFRIVDPKHPSVLKLAELFEVEPQTLCPEWVKAIQAIPKEDDKQAEFTPERLTQTIVHRLESSDNVEQDVDRALLEKKIESVLFALSFREREMVKLRFGIGTGYSHTYEELGKIYKVCTNRAREIVKKALRKLQHPFRARQLEQFLTPAPEPEETAQKT